MKGVSFRENFLGLLLSKILDTVYITAFFRAKKGTLAGVK